ncbi:glycosyltransferase family 2 protein [Vibrio crassostreae]|uniref:glycosyltransferase family 2 protein n=1 Tax=Vibrio crassostreae TaxID=246167 RepID=UPI00200A8D04|nr:glycosyltransferase family 2 protein [Vibrio crassostreae]UPR28460.1 glycosyltransferase family 2 protein [Vibrio crassostreae]
MSKPTLAVALIVKNEEKHLNACLDTVKDWVDEIVLLDSGSTDSTEEIARRYTNKFYTNLEWPGFGKQRQLAQNYVESDFVLWLDADERVTDELRQDILNAINHHCDKNIYRVNRLTTAFAKEIRYSGWSPDWVVRLYKTSETKYNDALVHESVVIPDGFKVVSLNGRLKHFTYERLGEYTRKTQLYMQSWADQREGKKSASLFSAFTHGFFRFFKMYIIKRGFLDGRHGFLLAVLSANTIFTRYADLWLRGYVKKHNKEQ